MSKIELPEVVDGGHRDHPLLVQEHGMWDLDGGLAQRRHQCKQNRPSPEALLPPLLGRGWPTRRRRAAHGSRLALRHSVAQCLEMLQPLHFPLQPSPELLRLLPALSTLRGLKLVLRFAVFLASATGALHALSLRSSPFLVGEEKFADAFLPRRPGRIPLQRPAYGHTALRSSST